MESVRITVQQLYQWRVFSVVYGACPLGVGLGQRSQLSLILLLPNSVSRVGTGVRVCQALAMQMVHDKNSLQGESLETGATHSTNNLGLFA